MWKRIGTAVVVGTLFAAALGTAAIATTDVAPTTDTTTVAEENTPLGEEGLPTEWQVTPEEIAEINAETDALVAYLEARGFTVPVETDAEGIRYPVMDEESDELLEAMNDFYEARFAEEVAAWSDEEKAAWNEDVDQMIVDFAAQGITATKVEIAPGVYDIDWTEDLEGAFFGGDDAGWDMSREDVAAMNAETDALVAYLEGRGIDVDVVTDGDFRYVDFGEDDEALMDAVSDFYEARFAEEVASWSDEEKASWNESIDQMVADFAAEGITATKVEIAPGVYDIDWTEELEGSLMYGDDAFWGMNEVDLAAINADTDALVSYLEGLGFKVDVETDDDGIRYPVVDENTDDALLEAINDYYMTVFVEEVGTWTDEQIEAWNADIDELIAQIESEGVEVDRIEIAPGVFDIDWTQELDDATTGIFGGDFSDSDGELEAVPVPTTP